MEERNNMEEINYQENKDRVHLARDGGGAHGADIGQVDVAAEIEWICKWSDMDRPGPANEDQ